MLTSEQELAIENLLTSTVTKVSDLVGSVVESWAYLLDYKPSDRPKYIEASFPNIDRDAMEKG
jgi:superoxide dismutase